jgi:hypothetical protein
MASSLIFDIRRLTSGADPNSASVLLIPQLRRDRLGLEWRECSDQRLTANSHQLDEIFSSQLWL